MGDDLENALTLVRRFVAAHYQQAETALLAGSRARGEGLATSDYDIVLLFSALPDGAWRESVLFESSPFEVFAHDLGTLAYFCREIDRPSGIPVLPSMVAEGVPALQSSSSLLDAARRIAQETLQRGPVLLDEDALRLRRHAITDLTEALSGGRDTGTMIAVGAALYTALADFALRAAGCWSASGKALPRALSAVDPALAQRFEAAFSTLFSIGETTPARALVEAVLSPYGGMLREGFRQEAPATWRDNAHSVR